MAGFLRGVLLVSTFAKGLVAEELLTGGIEDYPLSSRLAVAVSRAQLTASRSELVRAKSGGEIEVLAQHGQLLVAGEKWAVSNPETIELQRESLQLDEQALEANLLEMRLKHQEDLASLRKAHEQLEIEFAKLAEVRSRPDVTSDEVLLGKIEVATRLAAEELERSETLLAAREKGTAHDVEASKLRLDLRRKRLDFSRAKAAAEYLAPFDGRIEFLGSLANVEAEPEDEAYRLEVPVGEVVAAIIDDEHYEVIVPPVRGSGLMRFRSDLFAEIEGLTEDAAIRADFLRIDIDIEERRLPEKWVFRVLEEDLVAAQARRGMQVVANVFIEFEEPCRLVPKSELIRLFPEDARAGRWVEVLRKVWPGVVLVAEGQTALAVERAVETGEGD